MEQMPEWYTEESKQMEPKVSDFFQSVEKTKQEALQS